MLTMYGDVRGTVLDTISTGHYEHLVYPIVHSIFPVHMQDFTHCCTSHQMGAANSRQLRA